MLLCNVGLLPLRLGRLLFLKETVSKGVLAFVIGSLRGRPKVNPQHLPAFLLVEVGAHPVICAFVVVFHHILPLGALSDDRLISDVKSACLPVGRSVVSVVESCLVRFFFGEGGVATSSNTGQTLVEDVADLVVA